MENCRERAAVCRKSSNSPTGRWPFVGTFRFRVDKGEIVALIGANGAGKSTTLRAIAGLLPPRRGSIVFCGRDVTAMPSHERSTLGIALVPEGRHVFPFLTVRENLELGGFKSRNDGAKIRRMIGEIFDMFPQTI